MTKTKLILSASLALATLVATSSAQAATRQVDIGMQTLADRCIAQGGILEVYSPLIACAVADIPVECTFVSSHRAECSWPGIDNRIAVNRLIGMGNANSSSSGGGSFGGGQGGGGGGGIDLPDLPIDNGDGGGGIDLPDLPIQNK
jgi:uncharacterized membrane protein YgcG